jgi:hypothetical protein
MSSSESESGLVGLALVGLQRRLLADLQALADAGDLDRPVLLGAEEAREDAP